MTAGRPVPTQDDVLGYFRTLSNWGRWGDDDEFGTLNHITDDVRLAAARAVRHGRSVSCSTSTMTNSVRRPRAVYRWPACSTMSVVWRWPSPPRRRRTSG